MDKQISIGKHNQFCLEPGDVLLTTKEFAANYKISQPSQCRHRKDGTGPPFIFYNGKVLYPEKGILAWLSSRLVTSTAELSAAHHGNRYQHLPAARLKAQKLRETNSGIDSQP